MRKIGKLLITALALTALFAMLSVNTVATEQELIYTVIEVTDNYTVDLAANSSVLQPGTNALKIIIKNDIKATIYLGTTNDQAHSFPVVVEGEKQPDGSYPTITAGKSNLIQPMHYDTMTVRNLNIDMAATSTDGNFTQLNNWRGVYVNANATLIMENVNISNGYSTGAGGGVFVNENGKAILKNCTISNCYSASTGAGGGAIYTAAGTEVKLDSVTVSGCRTAGYGGGVYVNTNANVYLENTTVQNCYAVRGGAIYGRRGSYTHYYSGTISGNTCTVYGAGLMFDGAPAASITSDADMSHWTLGSGLVFSDNKRTDGSADNYTNNNGTACRKITISYDISTAADISAIKESTQEGTTTNKSLKNIPLYSLANSGILIRVLNDVNTVDKLFLEGAQPITLEGIYQEELGRYPIIKREGASAHNWGTIGLKSGAVVSIDKLALDANGYTENNGAITPVFDEVGIYLNAGTEDSLTTLTLGKDFVLKNAYVTDRNGAGIYAGKYCKITINGATIQDCIRYIPETTTAGGGGGIYLGDYTQFYMTAGTFGGNRVIIHSNATSVDGEVVFEGGAIYNYGRTSIVEITGGSFVNNSTAKDNGTPYGYGGGIAVRAGSAATTIKNVTIAGNSANCGGGIFTNGANATIDSATISDNTATYGGGVYTLHATAISDSDISNNSAARGGGVCIGGKVTSLVDVTVKNNDATTYGGGIYIASSTAIAEISGGTMVKNNTLKGDTVCNIQTATGFKSYDDEVYAVNNWQNGWIVIGGEFSGEIGIYYQEVMPTSMQIVSVKVGVLAENGQVLGTIANDNGYFVYAQGTDANGKACITMTAKETVDLAIKYANGGSQIFTIAKYGKYSLPDAEYLTPPAGYDADDFVGMIKVSGYGTADARAEAVLKGGYELELSELENVYATWVKVETIAGAAVAIDRDGLKFISKVEKGVLESVGLNVKSSSDAENGYSRGMLLGVVGKEDLTLGGNYGVNVTISNSGWVSAENYKKYTGAALGNKQNAFAVTLMFTSANASANYNKAVAFRGYIEITVGNYKVAIYSDCKLPEGGLANGDNVTYSSGVHARSARASIRNSIFSKTALSGTYSDFTKLYGKYSEKVCTLASINWDSNYNAWVKKDTIGDNVVSTYWNYLTGVWAEEHTVADYINPLAYQATADKTINIAIFGDGIVSAYNMGDILVQFAAEDGFKLNITAMQSNNAGQMSTSSYYSLFELYRDKTPALNNLRAFDVIGNGGSDNNGNAKNMWYLLSREANSYQPKAELDYFIAFSSRDTAITGANLTKNVDALYYLKETFKGFTNTKNTEFLVIAPPKYDSADNSYAPYSNSKSQSAIDAAAEAMADSIGEDAFSMGRAWEYFKANYSSSGIELYDVMESKLDTVMARYPSMAGAYYNACLIYGALFGKSPVGMECCGFMPESEATLLQQAAAAYLTSTGVTLKAHTGDNALTKTIVEVYDASKIETDTSFFKYVLANATAHYSRGNWIQYNQTAMNNYVATVSGQSNLVYRLDAADGIANPEGSSPQKTVYSDCSRWVGLVYADVFDNSAMRNTYTSCSKFYSNSRSGQPLAGAVVLDWTLSASTDLDAAETALKAAIQPGDLLLYNSDGSGGSHIVLYIGNGMVMHCTGDQAGSGGSDYNLNNNSDKRELVGGIKLDHLDIFTERWSYRYVFDPNSNDTVTLLRPTLLADYSDSKIAADAKARVDSLLGSVAYRTSTAPAGVTVAKNGLVTFTYTVENRTPLTKTHKITEVLPAYATFSSAPEGSYNSTTKTVTFNITVGPNETKSVTCTVKMTASNNTIVHFEKASIDGVPLTFAQVEVNGTLTTAQQNTVSASAVNNMSSYTDVYALAKTAYSGTGISLGNTAATVLNAMFKDYSVDNYKGSHPNYSYSVFYKAWEINLSGTYDVIYKQYYSGSGTSGFYGGQCVRRNGGTQHRIKDIYDHNLMVGDLILWIAREDCYAPGLSVTTSQASSLTDAQKKEQANALTIDKLASEGKIQSCMYIGDGEFIIKGMDGKLKIIGGSEARNLCEQFLGEGLWYLYRPSAK